MKTNSRWKAELALLGVTLIWGATFVAVKSALEFCSPGMFLFLRFSVAATALAVAFRRRAAVVEFWDRKGLAAGAWTGAALFGGYAFQTAGLRWTTATKSAFLTSTCVVLVPLLGFLVLKNRLSWRELAGAGVALCGAAAMSLQSGEAFGTFGDLLTLACAVSFAAHILLVGRFSRSVPYEVIALHQIGAAALFAGLSFWWMEEVRITWVWEVAVAVVLTGLLATALAFTVQVWAQQYTTPGRTVVIFALEPVFAAMVAYFFTSEAFSVRVALGALLILTGVLWTETKPGGAHAHPTS